MKNGERLRTEAAPWKALAGIYFVLLGWIIQFISFIRTRELHPTGAGEWLIWGCALGAACFGVPGLFEKGIRSKILALMSLSYAANQLLQYLGAIK